MFFDDFAQNDKHGYRVSICAAPHCAVIYCVQFYGPNVLDFWFERKMKFVESPAALVAYFTMFLGSIPDFVLSVVTVMVYVPEEVLTQFMDE